MNRREFFVLAGAASLAPGKSRAQQAEPVRRIGYFTAATGSPNDLLAVQQTRALVEGLRELGWFDGRNLSIEHHSSGIGSERIRAGAAELIARAPEVIFSVGGP